MKTHIGLRKLPIDTYAIVKTIKAEGDLGRRIRELGIIPGTRLKVTGRAPLKDPVALRLSGFTITLRNNEADHIIVQLEEQT